MSSDRWVGCEVDYRTLMPLIVMIIYDLFGVLGGEMIPFLFPSFPFFPCSNHSLYSLAVQDSNNSLVSLKSAHAVKFRYGYEVYQGMTELQTHKASFLEKPLVGDTL